MDKEDEIEWECDEFEDKLLNGAYLRADPVITIWQLDLPEGAQIDWNGADITSWCWAFNNGYVKRIDD